MTVSCLTKTEKVILINQYVNGKVSQADLSRYWNKSERTIHRVLEEAGIATPLERIKGDAYTVMQLLKEHGVDIPKLKQMLAVRKMLYTSSLMAKNDTSILNTPQ